MTNDFDILQRSALRQAGITGGLPELKRISNTGSHGEGDGKDPRVQQYHEAMQRGVNANPSRYQGDPRASRYIGSENSRRAAADEAFHDSVNPGGVWNDFGAGDGHTMNTLDEEPEYAEEEASRNSDDEKEEPESSDDEGDTADESPEDNGSDKKPGESPDEPAEEPSIGEPKPDKPPSADPAKAEKVAEEGKDLAKVAKGLGDTAKAAEGAEALAGAGAAGAAGAGATAVAVESNPVGWILTIVAIVAIVIIIIVALVALNIKYPSSPSADTGKPSIICLDPGHPSENAGAAGEAELVFKMATELKPMLEAKGYNVIMTKSSAGEKVLNAKRSEICAAGGAALMYRIHGDGTPRSAGYPYHIYPNPSMTNIYDTSKSYSQTIQEELVKTLGVSTSSTGEVKDGGTCNEKTCAGGRDLVGTTAANGLKLPVALIESIQMKSGGSSWLDDGANRKKFLTGIANGIAKAVPTSSGGGSSQGIIDLACKIKNDAPAYAYYKTIMLKAITDCYGFVSTVIKNTVDPNINYSTRAYSAVTSYFEKHPEKYTVIRGVNGISDLQPGDLLFNEVESGSHAQIFVGKGGCGCPRDSVSASLNTHEPRCSNWYSSLKTAVRLK